MNIKTVTSSWENVESKHKFLNELFTLHTNEAKELKKLRDWVETNIFGFGERSFYWMWKLLVDEMPTNFAFLEVGVFRGQILALIRLLSSLQNKNANIIGVSPMNSSGKYWDSNYYEDVRKIHIDNHINANYIIIEGLSTNDSVIEKAKHFTPDLLYIDGGHDYETVKADLRNYLPLLKEGGYLVIDDSATKFNLPLGYFRGHAEVSRAVDEYLPPFTSNKDFTFLFNIMHNRVFRKNENTYSL